MITSKVKKLGSPVTSQVHWVPDLLLCGHEPEHHNFKNSKFCEDLRDFLNPFVFNLDQIMYSFCMKKKKITVRGT